MAKKIKIDIDFSEENFILALSCHKKDYWMAFRLNEVLKLDLRRQKDLPYFHPKSQEIINFVFYAGVNQDNSAMFYLFPNSNPETKLFPEHRTTDFFLFVCGNTFEENKLHLQSNIKSISGILAQYEVAHSSLKDLGNFLSDLELHMLDMQKIKS